MVLVFAVFLIAVVLAFMTAEGRAARLARLAAFASRASNVGRALMGKGVDIAERIASELASDSRRAIGLDQLTRRIGRGPSTATDNTPTP